MQIRVLSRISFDIFVPTMPIYPYLLYIKYFTSVYYKLVIKKPETGQSCNAGDIKHIALSVPYAQSFSLEERSS